MLLEKMKTEISSGKSHDYKRSQKCYYNTSNKERYSEIKSVRKDAGQAVWHQQAYIQISLIS
jgi:hypothetical protein